MNRLKDTRGEREASQKGQTSSSYANTYDIEKENMIRCIFQTQKQLNLSKFLWITTVDPLDKCLQASEYQDGVAQREAFPRAMSSNMVHFLLLTVFF